VEAMDFSTDHGVFISDTQTAGVQAFVSSIQNGRRQPGSAIKPLLVYGPALDKNLITPYTKILDEPINYANYTPENYDKKYHGKVSITQAICQSYNIPAVKILNQLTLKTAETYAKKLKIPLENTDKNLSLALGGMRYGTTLQELCDGYTVFANGGNYQKSHFIKRITDNQNRVIYEPKEEKTKVFDKGTASLMNNILMQTAKTGTAKKLKILPYDIAAKTGTNGNKDGNLDAYTIGYTSQNTIGIWLGDKQNTRLSVTGGNECCGYLKDLVTFLYTDKTPQKLDTTSETTEVTLDKEEYKNNDKMILADTCCPLTNRYQVRLKENTAPTEVSTKFQHPIIQYPQITVNNNKIILSLCQTVYYSYLINRKNNQEITQIYDGNWQKEITDEPPSGTYSYTITPYYSYKGQTFYGKTITLPPVNLSNSNSENSSPQKIPDILSHDWFQE
jgi:membrane peptidoglycan carboxypeptidase